MLSETTTTLVDSTVCSPSFIQLSHPPPTQSFDIPITVVDSPEAVSELVDKLPQLPTDPPSIYIDLEGVNLSRDGSISIITLMVHPSDAEKHVYLINVHALNSLAFTSKGQNGSTLKEILESPTIPKVFFDVRNDSDALYAHFQVALQGIEDVQLMENGSRHCMSLKKYLNSLARCIEYDGSLGSYYAVQRWKLAKKRGDRLFNPSLGGSYEVFNENPLSEDIKSYCSGDVRYLPGLRNLYWSKLEKRYFWKEKVIEETRLRVAKSQSAEYQPRGADKALGPWQNYQPVYEDHYDVFGDPYLNKV